KDLDLLYKLSTMPFSMEEFEKLKVQYRIGAKTKTDGPAVLAAQLERSGQGTMAEMLETATAALGWGWLPEDDHVVIITRETAVARNLATRVTGQYADRNLGQILFELAREADVPIFLQPGTFK